MSRPDENVGVEKRFDLQCVLVLFDYSLAGFAPQV
jgi:hypothetical protein